MIDIHTHILPGIDDGSETLGDSIRMARLAAQSGLHTLVVTPHSNLRGIFDNYYGAELENKYQSFVEAVMQEHIPLKILLGMEIYASEEVPELLRQGKLRSLNYSRYLLIEFDFRKDLSLMDFLLDEMIHMGFRPIIAHPERYPYVQRHPDIVREWIDQGCSLQINKGSILGSFGHKARNTSLYLLEHNMASFVASDAHSPIYRTTDLSEVYQFITNNFSQEYADILLEENPKRVIEDQQLIDLYTMQSR